MANNKKRFKSNSPKQKNIYIVEMITEFIDGNDFPIDVAKWNDMEEFKITDFLGCSLEEYKDKYEDDAETKYVGTFSSYNKAESFLSKLCSMPLHKITEGAYVCESEPVFNILDEEDSSREIIHFTIRKSKMDTMDTLFMVDVMEEFGVDDIEFDICDEDVDVQDIKPTKDNKLNNHLNNIAELIENSHNNIKMSFNDNFKGGN